MGTLRTKFLLALALISALLTCATLLLVRYRVQVHAREEIERGLKTAVVTFQSLQRQRESTLETNAALLATLPPLKAMMTSRDVATIQDASTTFWNLSGSQVFALADHAGEIVALHSSNPGFTSSQARAAIDASIRAGARTDWWFGGGHLFEVYLQPIYFGSPEDGRAMGVLAAGYEIDARVAADVGRVASSQVAFSRGRQLVVTTMAGEQGRLLSERLAQGAVAGEVQLGAERYLATSVRLSAEGAEPVALTVMKSFNEATAFLDRLNRWIVAVGLAGVLAGSILVFVVSTTFTRPLAQLVKGVQALERGDFDYPLQAGGRDEVSTLTSAFQRMRLRLQDTQRQLLEAERLATIGKMANTISHDLRHPLTAILAYAEFLSENKLTETQRKDFFDEIRIAVNHMTDEINSLLGFAKQDEALKLAHGPAGEVIRRAIRTVKALPEFQDTEIAFQHDEQCLGWFDAAKFERVMLNLLFNAAEVVPPYSGKVEVTCRCVPEGMEIKVADNGPGIPEEIRQTLFQPFVTHGKEKGIGLGLTVVHKIVHDHRGEVVVESSDPSGTTFRLWFPAAAQGVAGAGPASPVAAPKALE